MRLAIIKPSTLRRQLGPLRHAFEISRDEWGYQIHGNPFAGVRLPSSGPGRARRLQMSEWKRLSESLGRLRNPQVHAVVVIALETAMRRSEILRASWGQIDLERGYWIVPQSKTGKARTIPLTEKVQEILKKQALRFQGDEVFAMSAEGFASAWKRSVAKAGIEDLTFHDLRHEAISRLFEKGLTAAQVASISGHHDTRMLARYTHIEVKELL